MGVLKTGTTLSEMIRGQEKLILSVSIGASVHLPTVAAMSFRGVNSGAILTVPKVVVGIYV